MMANSGISEPKVVECQSFLSQLLDDPEFTESSLATFIVRLRKNELEGEIIDILIKFLRKKNCPTVLIAPLISLTKERVLELDLAACHFEHCHEYADDYDPVIVCNTLFHVFKKVCFQATEDVSMLRLHEIKRLSHVNIHAIKNTRRKMEDRHAYYEDINTLFTELSDVTQSQSMFAVFDGHGGTEAAYYAATHLVCELKSCTNLLTEPGEALKAAIIRVDDNFVAKAMQDRIKNGCTAVVVLIQGVNLTVGWLGDSQVVLCKDGQAIQLMDPHKPDREDERERIEALGGSVLYFGGWRVNGSLGVSRAIGDYEMKPYITGEPDIEEYEMEGDEEFLIIACDGLWDTVEPLDAVECVQKCISDGVRDEAAEKLVTLAKDNNSMDNITVMVVYLDFNKVTRTDASN